MLSIEDVLPLHLADLTFPNGHPLTGQQAVVFAFAIRHSSGLVLFETGIGRGNQRLDSLYQVTHRTLESALEHEGLRLDDVRAVVNSHLHFDHCGANGLFPGVPIYVQAVEYQAAQEKGYTVPHWVDFPDAEYRQIEGDCEIAPGLRIIATPGHTLGHQSVLVETSEGNLILAGQAIYSMAEYDYIIERSEAPPGDPPPDPAAYMSSALRLIRMRARRVYFSHDASRKDSR